MKVRVDFVTNSSSSSFIVLGMPVDNWKNFGLPADEDDEVYDDFFETVYDGERDKNCVSIKGLVKQLHDSSVNQLKQTYVDKVKEMYGVEITTKNVSFWYGGWYNG